MMPSFGQCSCDMFRGQAEVCASIWEAVTLSDRGDGKNGSVSEVDGEDNR